jgi:hypothetical protein
MPATRTLSITLLTGTGRRFDRNGHIQYADTASQTNPTAAGGTVWAYRPTGKVDVLKLWNQNVLESTYSERLVIY